jgi:flagellar biosynthesis/type III secretory pathway protein FliH
MDAYLNAVLETNDIPEGTVYADALVKDLDTAMWAFKKIKAIKAKEEEINKAAEEEVKRIKEWQEKEVERLWQTGHFSSLHLPHTTWWRKKGIRGLD